MIATIDLENTYSSGVYSKRPVAIVRGCGASLWDAEGREYIDCAAGHGVANIGHGRLEVASAIASRRKGSHIFFSATAVPRLWRAPSNSLVSLQDAAE